MRAWIWGLVVLLGLAVAQEPLVPAELLKPRRRLQGNQITFCVNQVATLYAFDRAVGEAVAGALLLKPRFVELTYTGFGLLDDGDLLTNLYVDLTNKCDGFIGFNLSAGLYPEWLSFSRPYVKVPYVLAVTNPAYNSLADIPKGKAIGSGLGTSVDAFFGAYIRNLPEGQSWQRIPYGDFDLMIRRLKEGKLEGALIWAPVLYRIAGGNPEQAGLYSRSTQPIQSVESQLGIAMRAKDASLRTMVDGAVGSIIKDGTVQKLLQTHNILGSVGDVSDLPTASQGLPRWAWVLGGALGLLGLLGVLRRRRFRAR